MSIILGKNVKLENLPEAIRRSLPKEMENLDYTVRIMGMDLKANNYNTLIDGIIDIQLFENKKQV